jgi:hypothetical protein
MRSGITSSRFSARPQMLAEMRDPFPRLKKRLSGVNRGLPGPERRKMEYVIGLSLSVAVACFATVIGLARERSFYATVLIVVGSYYVLFAAMAASRRTLVAEIVVAGIFLLFAVLGFKGNLWLLAVGLMGHGAFDFVHHFVIDNPGVPRWWPGFCMAFDVLFGALLACRLIRHPRLSDTKSPQIPLV